MDKKIGVLVFFALVLCTLNSYASLSGDTVIVDRRFDNNVMSSRTVNIDSGIELIGWQNLHIDFLDYAIVMYPMSSIAYSLVEFNGFDFYDLNFALENEVVSSVNAYFVSKYNHDEIIGFLEPTRLDFSDDWISLNLAGTGFGSHPLQISIDTIISTVPIPPSFLFLLFGLSVLLLHRHKRKYI